MESPLEQLTNQITKLKDKHVFFFENTADNKKISKGFAGKYKSQNVWEYENIIDKYQSVHGFLKNLKDQGMPGVRILFYKKNGNRYLKANIDDVTCILNASSQPQPQTVTKPVTQPQIQQPIMTQPQTQPQPQPQNVSLAGPGQNVALGFAQYMDYVKKENRLELIEAEKNRLEAENANLKTEKSQLQIKLDEATSKCSLADERLNLEKEKLTKGQKSSFENLLQTPAAIAIADKLPSMIENLMKHGAELKANSTGLGGGNAADPFAGLTEAQTQLLKLLISAKLSDEMALNVYNIFTALQQNPSLMVSFNQFINQQQAV